MTKPVTGVAVMMMLEEGKIRLNDPVSKFIPECKDTKVAVPRDSSSPRPSDQRSGDPDFDLVPASRAITIRDLLTRCGKVPVLIKKDRPGQVSSGRGELPW